MSSINLCESHIKVIRGCNAWRTTSSIASSLATTKRYMMRFFFSVEFHTPLYGHRRVSPTACHPNARTIRSLHTPQARARQRAARWLHCVCAQLHRVQVAPRCRCRRSVSFLSFFSHSARRAIRAIRLSSIRAASVSASARSVPRATCLTA